MLMHIRVSVMLVLHVKTLMFLLSFTSSTYRLRQRIGSTSSMAISSTLGV